MAKAEDQSVIFSRTCDLLQEGFVSLLLGKVSKLGLSNRSHYSLPGQRDHEVFAPH